MNNPYKMDWKHEEPEKEDPMAPAKGVLTGLIIGTIMWFLLFWAMGYSNDSRTNANDHCGHRPNPLDVAGSA